MRPQRWLRLAACLLLRLASSGLLLPHAGYGADPDPCGTLDSLQGPNCSCYRFTEGLFLECRGAPPPLRAAINSLTIHELPHGELTATVLPQTAALRQLQISHSAVHAIHDRAFDRVRDHLESLIIVFSKLKRIPQKALNGLVALRSLDFEANEIEEIASYTFYGLKLFKLVLKSNLLATVTEYAFAGLEKTLTELDLSENRLREFPVTSLRLLDNLMSVRLGWNEITAIRDDGYSRVSSLRVLDLSSNNFQNISANCFRPMSALTTLTLYSNTIDNIHVDAFTTLLHLEYVDLSHNKIIHLEPGTFRYNRNLRTVDITRNHIHALGGIFKKLPQLVEVFISENNVLDVAADSFTGAVSVNVIRLVDNAIRRLDKSAFVTQNNLTELYLTGNYIETLHEKVFAATELLISLHLDKNHIFHLASGVFASLKHLRELRLNDNRLKVIKSGLFESLISLLELHLQNNALHLIEPGSLGHLKNLQHVNLQGNIVSELKDVFRQSPVQTGPEKHAKNTTKELRDLQIMWLSHNVLTKLDQSVFTDLLLIQRIYFNNNTIEAIEDRSFAPMQALVFLELSQNFLTSITQHTFADLYQLEELYLARNRLLSVAPFAFNSLKKLRVLDLSENKFKILHENMFQSGLPIRVLSLRRCGITEIRLNAFRMLNNLNELNLEENQLGPASLDRLNISGLRIFRVGWNSFRKLESSSLGKLPSLQTLQLENCSIQQLPNYMFARNKELVTLTLSRNSLRHLEKFTLKEQRNLVELRLAGNLLEQVPYQALFYVPALVVLDLAANFIASVNLSRLTQMPNLREINFRDNRISSLVGVSPANFAHIQILYLSGNRLSTLPGNFFGNFPHLRKLDVSRNFLRQLPLADSSARGLTWLNVSANPLKLVRDPMNAHRMHLEELLITKTNLTILTSQDLEIFPRLLHLHLNDNRITRISPSAFAGLGLLLTLDLSINDLDTLPPERLQGMRELRLLNISHNRLKDLEPFPKDLRELQVLDLSDNQLTRVRQESFLSLPHLTELRLTSNWISSINGESFKPLKKLSVLDLSRNYLDNLPLSVIQPLESQIRSLKAEENPLTCGCEQQEMWAWLKDHERLGAGDLRCEQPPQLRGQLFLQLSAMALCTAPLLVKLAIQDIQPFSLVVSWQSRNYSGLRGFQVFYSNQDLYYPVKLESEVLERSSRSVRVAGLEAGTRYQVCVTGLGPWQQTTPAYATDNATDSATSKCTTVRTLHNAADLSFGSGDRFDANSVLTRRLGLIVGSSLGSAVFFILISVLGYLKLKKQRQVAKRDQPGGVPSEFSSYSIYPTS